MYLYNTKIPWKLVIIIVLLAIKTALKEMNLLSILQVGKNN